MRIKVVLAAALTLIAVVMVMTLSHSPTRSTFGRSVPPVSTLVFTTADAHGCQRSEALPADTTAIRFGLFAVDPPEVLVQAYAGSRRVTQGTLHPGWEGDGATVPVEEVPHAVAPVKVCFELRHVVGMVQMLGATTSAAHATYSEGQPLPGRISIEYLQPSHRSWWSRAGGIIQRMGLGHAASGSWDALLVFLLAATVLTLSSWLVVRELR
jgi:hypothetical protein